MYICTLAQLFVSGVCNGTFDKFDWLYIHMQARLKKNNELVALKIIKIEPSTYFDNGK